MTTPPDAEESYTEDFVDDSRSSAFSEADLSLSTSDAKGAAVGILENRQEAEVCDSESIVLSVMSPIQEGEEENSSRLQSQASNPESRVPDELKELQHYFEACDEDDELSKSISKSETSQNVTQSSANEGIEEIMKKLERLSATQALLEQVLDGDGDINNSALEKALASLPMVQAAQTLEEENSKSMNLSKEMESLRKLLNEENSEGKNPERELQEVLKEYDELERSCDEQESIRSEPKVEIAKDMETVPKILSRCESSSSNEEISYGKKSKMDSDSPKSSPSRTRTRTLTKKPQVSPPIVGASAKSASTSKIPNPSSPKNSTTKGKNAKESLSSASLLRQPPTPRSPTNAKKARTITTLAAAAIKSPSPRFQQKLPEPQSSGDFNLAQENDIEKEKLAQELFRTEQLLAAYQDDNQKLYGKLKEKETEHAQKESELESLVNSLKTEVATLKLARIATTRTMSPSKSRPSSATASKFWEAEEQKYKSDIEKLKTESGVKSDQILELRKEIVGLRNSLSEVQNAKPTAKKSQALALEKEKEAQKQIRALNKQVRTLQKILYSKDPSAAEQVQIQGIYGSTETLATFTPLKGRDDTSAQISVYESRIAELERDLAAADADAKERLKDFQQRFQALKSKYEQQSSELELQLQESISKLNLSSSSPLVAELQTKLERASSELASLKLELSRAKRELEIAQKSSALPLNSALAKADAGNLSLALKSFKSELGDKEKEIVRLKKELNELQKTNCNLKREREKYLGVVTRVSASARSGVGIGAKAASSNSNLKVLGSPVKSSSSTNLELLQATLDYERTEFESMIANKRKELYEKDQTIQSLRKQLSQKLSLSSPSKTRDDDEVQNQRLLLDELRARVKSQNELILQLKEHISSNRKLEAEFLSLQLKYREAASQVQELKQKLEMAEVMARPENEVLGLLAQKFEDLTARYLQREAKMESLLNKLSAKTSTSTVATSPRFVVDTSTSSSSPSPEELIMDLRQLSPSLSVHLFGQRK